MRNVLLLTMGAAGYALHVAYLKSRERRLAGVLAERDAQLAAARERLESLARLDGLTGIANHRAFKEFLQAEWQRAQRARTPVSVLMLDVDFFKLFNDTYGHQAGDDCLISLATVLRESAHRPGDLAARYGGEEFAVVLGGTDEAGAFAVAEVMRQRVEALRLPHVASTVAPVVTVSVGVATAVPDAETNPSQLVTAADVALYEAKEQGRNRTRALIAARPT